jgi:LytR cell envelope-related transcriptional attenuator
VTGRRVASPRIGRPDPVPPRRGRSQRGIVFPSPLMILSIVAVAMAGVAWFATRHHEPTERLVTPTAQQSPSAHRSAYHRPQQSQVPQKPAFDRSKVLVEVFNNSTTSGLAGQVAGRASRAGWQVVGSDNWYGTIPATTIYYPERLKAAAKLLSKDLGIERVIPAVDPMSMDRLTVILTADYS